MLRSYISFSARGQVVLRREIITQLGMGPNGVLYGALYPPETALILSPIPPSYWERAYKIIIHTRHIPGCLAAAANAIADMNLDTISSWASMESYKGHLSSTSIVVCEDDLLKDSNSIEEVEKKIYELMGDKISDLPVFGKNKLLPVRITPLSILLNYKTEMADSDFHLAQLDNFTIQLNSSRSLSDKPVSVPDTLWTYLLNACEVPDVSACVLTPDTEEAFVRLSVIAESARICRLAFHLSISSEVNSFAGYWKHALDLLASKKYSVLSAHNLIISKSDVPPSEDAEFHFVLDRKQSQDVGIELTRLREVWRNRLEKSFKKLAHEKNDDVEIKGIRVSRPKGVGVPCFFSTNAKPGDGIGAETAQKFCKLLEGFGFKPVNVDLAKGGRGLREQVRELVLACKFMVVLYCPEANLEIPPKGSGLYRASDWVMFEEGLMEANGGEVLRLRFSNVVEPSFNQGFTELQIPAAEGVDRDLDERLARRLERWTVMMFSFQTDNVYAPDIPLEYLERDLVEYYGGR